jgi:HTH-type transcriptional regulator/antitoxin HigA
MNARLKETQKHWQAIGPLLTIRDKRDYAAAVERLDSLLKEIGDDEQHPLYGLLDTLGTLIHAYEEEHVSIPEASAPEVLEYLMEEHGLAPEDLARRRQRRVEDKLEAVRSAVRHSFPTADIEQMLCEIEQG